MNNVHERILHYIQVRGIKQTHLAEKCGMTRQKFSKIMKGQQNLTVEDLIRISEALGVPRGYFLE